MSTLRESAPTNGSLTEEWWLVRKPLREATVAAQVLATGTGALNIDGTRVEGQAWARNTPHKEDIRGGNFHSANGNRQYDVAPQAMPEGGRWPPHLVLSHAPDCTDATCNESCPIAELDRQSGRLDGRPGNLRGPIGYSSSGKRMPMSQQYLDKGGASRYFPTFRFTPAAAHRPEGEASMQPEHDAPEAEAPADLDVLSDLLRDSALDETHDLHLLLGDALAVLRELPDECVDAVVTDPPAGISFMNREWDGDKGGRDHWIAWLSEIMTEALRVLKPGGHALVWALPRTSHWTGMALEDAGFEVRERLSHIFGSGFPKSLNVALEYEQRLCVRRNDKWVYRDTGEAMRSAPPFRDDDANRWVGWATALKPAVEDWWAVRKPMTERTVASQVLATGTGALNIDGTRVSGQGEHLATPQSDPNKRGGIVGAGLGFTHQDAETFREAQRASIERTNALGRWPAHLVLTHSVNCKRVGTRKVGGTSNYKGEPGTGGMWSGLSNKPVGPTYGDEHGEEEVEVWECDESCPIRELDTQSGALDGRPGNLRGPIGYGSAGDSMPMAQQYLDKGGASRYFSTFRYVAKPSRAEREMGLNDLPTHSAGEATGGRQEGSAGLNSPRAGAARKVGSETGHKTTGKGLSNVVVRCPIHDAPIPSGSNYYACGCRHVYAGDGTVKGVHNIHPTVKALELMRWLVRLVTPPNGWVLDPFCGSGTTGLACIDEGMKFIGIDNNEQYLEIARARTRYYAITASHRARERARSTAPRARTVTQRRPHTDDGRERPVTYERTTPRGLEQVACVSTDEALKRAFADLCGDGSREFVRILVNGEVVSEEPQDAITWYQRKHKLP